LWLCSWSLFKNWPTFSHFLCSFFHP
jgi:hypothetical protein